MTLINKALLSLTGGVSQQAPALRLTNQGEQQENYSSSLVNGLQTRAPLQYIGAGGNKESAFYAIDRDTNTPYNLIISETGLEITNGKGTKQPVTNAEGALNYLAITTGANPYEAYKVLTLADHTFILNTQRKVQMTNQAYEAWKNQALVFIKQVNYTTTWTLQINNTTLSFGYGGQENDGTVKRYINGTHTGTGGGISSSEVASELAKIATELNKLDGNQFTITQKASTLWIRRNDGQTFTIGLADTRSDTCATLVTQKVQNFDTLPTVAPDGYIARIVGSVASRADDYYVIFNTNADTDFGRGVWEECAEPGDQYAIDPKTMPWKLINNNNGTWDFKPCTWAEKTTGDTDSQPLPSFIGKKLRNIFLYRNRLCLLTEDLLCMSRAAEYENWWNETALSMSDADPIYLSASTERVADLYDFGILNESLIILGEKTQYQLNTGDILSPKTASLTPIASTSYTNATGVVSAGVRLYFGCKTGNSYSASEFGTSSSTGNKEASTITSHIPSYIPFGKQARLCGSDNVSTLLVCTDAEPDTLSVYQYYISGSQKLQAAWHKYTITGTKIKGALFRENILWLHLEKENTGTIICTLDMAEHPQDERSDITLDYGAEHTADTPTTQWTIPAHINPKNAAILRRLPTGLWTHALIQNITGHTLTLRKPETAIYIGEKYKRKYTFSTQYVSTRRTDGSEKVNTSGRWQLQTLKLSHGQSGVFTVTVSPFYLNENQTYKYTHTAIDLKNTNAQTGSITHAEGEYTIPLRGLNTAIKVTIESDAYTSESFISADWQGNFIMKVKNI